MENVATIADFKTKTLHQYMTPIYAQLNFHQNDSVEVKRALLKSLLPKFCQRMRKFRGIPLSQISNRFEIPVDRLERFEADAEPSYSEIVGAYISSCGGDREWEVFSRQIKEFEHPELKERRREHALMAWRFGGFIGIDIAKVSTEEAQVLKLPSRTM